MPLFQVSEKGRKPQTVTARYEAAAATNYVAQVAPGQLRTVRRVHVRQLVGKMPLGNRQVFDVVDHGVSCQAMEPQRSAAAALAVAEQGLREGEPTLRNLALELGVPDASTLPFKELIEAISQRMPTDGSTVTVASGSPDCPDCAEITRSQRECIHCGGDVIESNVTIDGAPGGPGNVGDGPQRGWKCHRCCALWDGGRAYGFACKEHGGHDPDVQARKTIAPGEPLGRFPGSDSEE